MRCVVYNTNVNSHTKELGNCKNAVIAPILYVREQIRGGMVVKLRQIEVACADLKRADSFQQALLKRSANAHNLARCLHLRGELV